MALGSWRVLLSTKGQSGTRHNPKGIVVRFTRIGATLAIALSITLSGCAVNEMELLNSGADTTLKGTIQGTGASSQKVAQTTWIAEFQTAHLNVTINYSPEGSGAGRESFMGGGADFAGSDRALKDEENTVGGFGKCTKDSIALDLPVYISPIAIIYNVKGIDKLNLDAATTAGIFKGSITKWNDPKIAALNPGVKLPSGTTENFTDYLHGLAPDVWEAKAGGDWPYETGEGAKGTSGVVAAVKNGVNTIGYADDSQAGNLKKALVGENGDFAELDVESASAIVENSPQEEGRDQNDLALKLDRRAEGYPIVLVSYAIVCQTYRDAKTAEVVKAYIGYLASDEGQQAAAKAAGIAPLSPGLSAKVKTALDSVK